MSFMGGNVDPCAFYKVNEIDTVYLAVYVDDNLIIGDEAAVMVMEVISKSKLKENSFTLKADATLDDYLSCSIMPHQVTYDVVATPIRPTNASAVTKMLLYHHGQL
eukprot:scaffold1149_cov119-Skeletonema_dohrnii-CCMP3373.AAC.5